MSTAMMPHDSARRSAAPGGRSAQRVAPAILALAVLAACQDSTAPSPAVFDGQRVEAGALTVERVAASSALASLQQVARFGGQGSVAARAGSTWSPGLEGAVSRIVGSATDAGTYLVPVMRQSVLGKVLVFDPAQRTYVPSARTGAPANGARFILYAETASGDPIVGQEIGHADLTDEQRASTTTAGVKLVVVINGVTRLSYDFEVSVPGESPTFAVRGFMTNGDDRLDFTVNATSTLLGNGPATVTATIAVPKQGFTVTATMTGRPENRGAGKVDLVVSSGSDRIVVDVSTTEGVLNATFTVNGTLLARATGSPDSPVIRGADGQPLREGEMRALARIVEMSGAIFRMVGELVEPAGHILLLAISIGR